MKQDKYGIYVPEHTKIPLGHDRPENTTRIYTTKNGKPMTEAEAKQCLGMYEQEFKLKAVSVILPDVLASHAKDFTAWGYKVAIAAARPNQITLSQI